MPTKDDAMETPCTIVECDLGDVRHRRALIALINAYRLHPMGGRLPKLAQSAELDLIAGLKNHPCSLILFACFDKKVAGVAVCFMGFSTFSAKPLINVHDLVVAPRYRRCTVGRAIMEAVIRRAEILGCCRVTLEVRSDNSVAKRLYSGIGFGPCPVPMEFWVKSLKTSLPRSKDKIVLDD